MASFCLIRVLLLLLIQHHFVRSILSYGYGGHNEMKPPKKKSPNIFDPDCFLTSILNLTVPRPARNLLESMTNISNTPLQTADGRNQLSNFPIDEPKIRDKVSLAENKMIAKVSRSKKGIPDSLSVQILDDNSGTTKLSRTILKDRQLIKNPDFEHGLKGWTCYYCRATRVTGGYRSKYAAKIVNNYGYGGHNEMKPPKKKSPNIFDPGCFLTSILNLTVPRPARNLPESMTNISNTPLQTADGRNQLSNFPIDEPKIRDKVSLAENKMIAKVSRSKKGIPDSLSVQILDDNSGTTKLSRTILKERELIKNPDFERDLNGWICYYCRATRVTGGYRSKYAAKIVNKDRRLGNLRTFLNAKQGFYYFTAYVKILNPARMNIPTCPVTAYAKIIRSKGPIYLKLGETLRVQPNTRWYKVGGDFYVPANSNYMEVYVTVRMRKLHYLFDHASCSKIDYLPNWKEESNRRIKKIRKANIEVRLNVTSVPKGYRLKITQTKEKFKWGGCVKTWLINNPRYRKFSNFIYKNFNWGVIENALKWANDEPQKGKIRLSAVKKTVDLLRRHQLYVRGHTLFYGISDPPWVKKLKGKELLMALKNRIKDFMVPFKNKITNWDVSNENLRSSTYEILTHDPNITQKMFMMAHKEDTNAHLYFNENMIVNYGFSTVALEDRAVMYQEAGIPLHGIGIQSHMRGNVNVFVLMRRLDEVAKAGLPLFISELTYENKDVRKRVLSYDNLLRVYFSHPAVEGIMFWTVWANHWRETAALLDQHFNVNEVGKLFLSLKSEWSTSPIEYDLSRPVKKFSVFLGEYCAELTKSGQTIWKKCFPLERPTSTAVLVIGDSQEGSRQE